MVQQHTYKLNRRCLHCNKPIADQEHASRIYCPRVVLDGGGVVCCKDDYNSKKNKPLNAPFKVMMKWHKYYHGRIKRLYEEHGDIVEVEMINRFGINLQRPFEFKKTKEERFVFYYHEYAIEQLPDNRYKISKHGLF